MAEPNFHRASGSDVTKAVARLPGLDIGIGHERSPAGDWEQVSIVLRATPSFEAFGRSLDAANPFALWTQAVRMMWAPWLLAVQPLLPKGSPTRKTFDAR